MSDHTLDIPNAEIQATEAPDITNDAVDINTPSRPTRASERAPKKPKVISVSFDDTT